MSETRPTSLSSPREPRLRKRRRGVAILPALFTLGNCLAGFMSISYASRGDGTANDLAQLFASNYATAGYFIFLAMVFDMFDGFVARLTRSASDFGAELDSLADMVSFGIAPAFLCLQLIGSLMTTTNPARPDGREFLAHLPGPFSDAGWSRLFWVIAATYVSCTALRLARFNVINKHEINSHMSFKGMPSPGAASVVAATVIFIESLRLPSEAHRIPFNVSKEVHDWLITIFPYLLPFVLLIAALLMVSRFSYSHLINRFLRGRKKFRTVVVFLFLAMVIVWQPQLSAIIAIYLYALSAPVTWLFQNITGKRPPTIPPATLPQSKSQA